jgi:hypothetical protein
MHQGGLLPVVRMPPLATQKVTIGGSSTASNAFNAKTRMIAIHTDAICSIEFSATPGAATAATSGSKRMAANTTEYFEVAPGDKVSVITNS